MAISTLLFDFDGVIRHFTPNLSNIVENTYNLSNGSILEAAFRPGVYPKVARGEITKKSWIETTIEIVGHRESVETVLNDKGSIDASMINLLDRYRKSGMRIALLTNSTCTIDEELKYFNLHKKFDSIFMTNKIGFAKPDKEIYEHVCNDLQVTPEEVFFTDDLEENVIGARSFGIFSEVFHNKPNLESNLERLLQK